jgi:hypothetical protein
MWGRAGDGKRWSSPCRVVGVAGALSERHGRKSSLVDCGTDIRGLGYLKTRYASRLAV